MSRRLLLALVVAGAVWLLGTWPPPSWWRTHWPRQTAMMRLRGEERPLRPTHLDSVAPVLQRMVILAEDSRFRSHRGIDPAEMRDALGMGPDAPLGDVVQAAWRRRDRLRGASTITQQVAKNLYLSPSRNPLRKVKEIATAFRLEGALSKDRILELYLSVAEWGPGVWGAAAASYEYYGVSPARLSPDQAAALAATLPHPRTSNPAYRPSRMEARRRVILARYFGADVDIPPPVASDRDSLIIPPVDSLPLPPPDTLPSPPDTVVSDTVVDSSGTDTIPQDTTKQDTAQVSPRGVFPLTSRLTSTQRLGPSASPRYLYVLASRQSTKRRGMTRAR